MSSDLALAVPADPESARIVRAVANAVAAAESFVFDALGDLDLAIDEGFAALLEAGDGRHMACGIAVDDRGLSLELSRDSAEAHRWPDPGWSESLGAMVLAAVATDVEYLTLDDRPAIRFSIRHS